MIRRLCIVMVMIAAHCDISHGQDLSAATGFLKRVFRDDQGDHKYAVFVPRAYRTDQKWPVIFYLHSAGERGEDGLRQLRVGLGPAIVKRAETFPFIAIFPQCEHKGGGSIKRAWWSNSKDGQRAIKILDEVMSLYSCDPARVYLTGNSMGGFGSWQMGYTYPRRWAAIAPICGGGDPKWAKRLSRNSIWCFHGTRDRLVPIRESRNMVDAIRAEQGTVRLTAFPGVEHNSWDKAYDTDELYSWFLKHRQPQPVTGAENGGIQKRD